MDKMNWSALAVLTTIVLAALKGLGDMITAIKKDLVATNDALRVHIVEDKAVAEDVRELKLDVRNMQEQLHRIDVNTTEIRTIVQRNAAPLQR